MDEILKLVDDANEEGDDGRGAATDVLTLPVASVYAQKQREAQVQRQLRWDTAVHRLDVRRLRGWTRGGRGGRDTHSPWIPPMIGRKK